MSAPFVIAIDGPAASGKGTLAKRLAVHFNLAYLDTGKLYRGVAYRLLQKGTAQPDTASATEAARVLTAADLDNPALADERVGQLASTIAAIPEVRAALHDFQQQFAAIPPGAVLDGRDIGTVICPKADIKLFVTASLEARAERRFKELQKKEFSVIYENILKDLQERDDRDSNRAVAPLAISPDATYIDTTAMTADAAFRHAVDIISAIKNALP
jgi:cytidylate kinase